MSPAFDAETPSPVASTIVMLPVNDHVDSPFWAVMGVKNWKENDVGAPKSVTASA